MHTEALGDFNVFIRFDMAAGRYGDRIIGDKLDSKYNYFVCNDVVYNFFFFFNFLACECYVIIENCFRDIDMYGATDWGVLTYYKWLNDGNPRCVDVNKLNHYLSLLSVHTGKYRMTLREI